MIWQYIFSSGTGMSPRRLQQCHTVYHVCGEVHVLRMTQAGKTADSRYTKHVSL